MFPCRKCRRTFWTDKKLSNHDCKPKEVKPPKPRERKPPKAKADKPPKIDHKRGKTKRGNVTVITDKVRREVNRRSMSLWDVNTPCCERCGYTNDLCGAHMENASQGGTGGHPANIVNLCGTHGMGGYNGQGGCHDWADNSLDGREWKKRKAAELEKYYKTGEGRKHWKV